MQLWHIGLILLAAVNIAAYFFTWLDKKRAIHNQWRISENSFFLLSLLGGFIGLFLGMRQFRHKTKHLSFYAVIVVSALIWLIFMPLAYVKLEIIY